jgi:hypothetical protein
MKKSVIVLIGVIYILAVAIVSFFGLQIETFNETIYVNNIECTNEVSETHIIDGVKYIIVDYVDDADNPTAVQLEWRVYPDNASRKIVKFAYDETSDVAEVNAMGTVIFHKKGAITVYIMATDGSSKSVTVKVIAL